jgi:hypothetical protein
VLGVATLALMLIAAREPVLADPVPEPVEPK